MNPLPRSFLNGVRFSRDGTRIYCRGRYDTNLSKDRSSCGTPGPATGWLRGPGDSGQADAMHLAADNRSLLVGDNPADSRLSRSRRAGSGSDFSIEGQVLSAAFHPDGTKAVSSSPDAPVYIWDLFGNPGQWDARRLTPSGPTSPPPTAGGVRRGPQAAGEPRRGRLLPARAGKAAGRPVRGTGRGLAQAPGRRAIRRPGAGAEGIDCHSPNRSAAAGAARKTAFEETARRLDQVLKSTEEMKPERLRQVRACEVLEGIGTPQATRVLREWSGGPPGSRLTIETRESLARR